MGLFDVLKKKNQPTILWQEKPLISGASVEYYVKKILKDYPKETGVFYINDGQYAFSYGNLSDIIDPNIMPNLVKRVYRASDSKNLYIKIEY